VALCVAPALALASPDDLKAALESGNVEAARRQIAADPGLARMPTESSSWGPLHLAAEKGQLAIVELLLAGGAKVKGRIQDGSTPLHVAARAGQLEAMKLLIAKGAPVDARDSRGDTPLHRAALIGEPGPAELLLASGADSSLWNTEGKTALHEVAAHGRVAVAAVLCAYGADPQARDDAGQTPLDLVRKSVRDDGGSPASFRKDMLDWMSTGCARIAALRGKDGPAPKGVREAMVLEAQCEHGDAWACTNLGVRHEHGQEVPKDAARAAAFYQRGCDGGNQRGCAYLGSAYEDGQGVKADPARAATLYQKACDGKDDWGCVALGVQLEQGKAVAKDEKRAVELYRQACQNKLAWGCARLGWVHEQGHGVAVDLPVALDHYQAGCTQGNSWSCARAARMLAEGRGAARDPGQAAALYKRRRPVGLRGPAPTLAPRLVHISRGALRRKPPPGDPPRQAPQHPLADQRRAVDRRRDGHRLDRRDEPRSVSPVREGILGPVQQRVAAPQEQPLSPGPRGHAADRLPGHPLPGPAQVAGTPLGGMHPVGHHGLGPQHDLAQGRHAQPQVAIVAGAEPVRVAANLVHDARSVEVLARDSGPAEEHLPEDVAHAWPARVRVAALVVFLDEPHPSGPDRRDRVGVGIEPSHQHAQGAGPQPVVVVEEHHVLPARFCQRQVRGPGSQQLLLRQEHPHPGGLQALQPLPRAIRRRVVDEEKLPGDTFLG
jgi:hypothetical protein